MKSRRKSCTFYSFVGDIRRDCCCLNLFLLNRNPAVIIKRFVVALPGQKGICVEINKAGALNCFCSILVNF